MKNDTVTLFIATGCAHCAALLELLEKRVKSGAIAKLEIINIASAPEVAQQLNLRSVPVTRIGPFEFEGVLDTSELDKWINLATTKDAVAEYIANMLSNGKLNRVQRAIKQHPEWLADLVRLLKKPLLPMQARVGIVAVMEEIPAEWITEEVIGHLQEIVNEGDTYLQTDALHILSLYRTSAISEIMQRQLNSSNDEMREIAQEYMEKG